MGLLHKDKPKVHDPSACRVTGKMKTDGNIKSHTTAGLDLKNIILSEKKASQKNNTVDSIYMNFLNKQKHIAYCIGMHT